jgi:hypothetical protein
MRRLPHSPNGYHVAFHQAYLPGQTFVQRPRSQGFSIARAFPSYIFVIHATDSDHLVCCSQNPESTFETFDLVLVEFFLSQEQWNKFVEICRTHVYSRQQILSFASFLQGECSMVDEVFFENREVSSFLDFPNCLSFHFL